MIGPVTIAETAATTDVGSESSRVGVPTQSVKPDVRDELLYLHAPRNCGFTNSVNLEQEKDPRISARWPAGRSRH